jgi:hypothetical protein
MEQLWNIWSLTWWRLWSHPRLLKGIVHVLSKERDDPGAQDTDSWKQYVYLPLFGATGGLNFSPVLPR